jgi:hypothetical protein
MLGGKDVQFGQLAPADLANFVGAIRMLVAFLAAMGAMAPHEVGITTDNPASAEAIKSSETGKVKRAERMQRAFGGSHEDVMRLAEAVRRGVAVADLPKEFHAMETVWRDAATPTVAQVADAAAKLVPIGVYDVEFAQEKVGMSPQQRQEIRTRRSEALATAATADVEARMALARRLVAEDGMTLNAALAVVGYPIAATANAVPAPAA